jgi:putative phosphoesterase
MMNFLILSDSHRNRANAMEAVKRSRNIDAILFLGDGLGDLGYDQSFMSLPVFSVRGNCDMFFSGDVEDELILHFEEYTVMMMHGHRFGVKSSFSAAAAHAANKGADILLFGHTHIPMEKYLDAGEEICGAKLKKPLHVFNPGSIGTSSAGHYSFGTMTLDKKGILFGHGKI